MVFTEINYSSDGAKSYEVNLISGDVSENYTHSFSMEGVSIENYERTHKNDTNYVLSFDLRNSWYSGEVNWSVTDPSISNTSNLENNESLFVFIENDYNSQGDKKPEITAGISTFVDRISDFFSIKPLEIDSLITLSEGVSSVSEMVVKNNLNSSQQFDWTFDTGVENVSSDNSLDISTDNVFIFIESDYSDEGVYRTNASVSSSEYSDDEKGVVVV